MDPLLLVALAAFLSFLCLPENKSALCALDSSSSLLLNLFTCDLLDYQAMQLCMGAPLIPTLVKPDGWPTLVCLCKVCNKKKESLVISVYLVFCLVENKSIIQNAGTQL